ncbi:MAG: antiterminator LoaP [Acetivibrionales bacterium]
MYGNSDRWYALFVKTGEEDNVRDRLEYKLRGKGLRIVVPKRRIKEKKKGVWEHRLKSLFPGYILLNGQIGLEEYYLLKGVPGLLRILKDDYGPLEIEEKEISIIARLIRYDEIIGSSKVFIDNGKVVVVDGPLLGMEGHIQSIDKRKGRAKVRINFIGQPRLVDLSVSMIQPF